MSLFQEIARKPLPDDYHHPLSASKAKLWLPCPAAATNQGKGRSSSAADFGTKVHEYAEKLSRGLLPVTAYPDPVAKKAAQEYLDAVAPFLSTCDEVKTEYRVYLDNVPTFLYDPLSGTADKIGVREYGPLVVADLKTGFVDVAVEDNDQLDFYALGAFWALRPEVRATVSHVVQIIVQVNSRVGCEVKVATRSLDELAGFAARVGYAVDAAELTPDIFVAGKHCAEGYCGHMLKCKAHLQFMHDHLGGSIEDLDPEDITADAEKLETALDILPTVKAWCKAVEAAAEQQIAETPEAFTHYKLVASFGHRKLLDEIAFGKAAKEAGVDDLIWDKKLKTPAALEKLPETKALVTQDTVYKPCIGYHVKKL